MRDLEASHGGPGPLRVNEGLGARREIPAGRQDRRLVAVRAQPGDLPQPETAAEQSDIVIRQMVGHRPSVDDRFVEREARLGDSGASAFSVREDVEPVGVAIVRKRLSPDLSLYKLLQILSVTLFEKMPTSTAVLEVAPKFEAIDDCNQLQLFDL